MQLLIVVVLASLLPYPDVGALSSPKRRAPRAIKAIKEFTQKVMGTKDVRVDVALNKFLWSQGIQNVPFRVRVRCARKRNEDEDAAEKLYTHVTHIQVESFKNLQSEKVEA